MTTVEPAHLEATVADQTPIPADPDVAIFAATEAALQVATAALKRFESGQYGDLQASAVRAAIVAVDAAAPILIEAGRAAGRTAAAEDALMAARDDLVGVADRLRAKARETGDKAHVGMAAGVDLACFRLVELADRAARVAENGADRGVE
ncbi:hypothetical protein ABGB07_02205 [Micromonosporaceae bacterium B7E4]